MKITIEQILEKGSWTGREVLRSINSELITPGIKEFDIKLLINGIEHEPQTLEDLFKNLEGYIDREAEALAKERFYDLSCKMRKNY